MAKKHSSLKRAGAAPLALAIACGLLLMQTSTQCVPEDLLSSQTSPAQSENGDDLNFLESGRTLTEEELQQLVANAKDEDIVVVFTNPIPGPPGPPGVGLIGEIRMWAGHPAHPPAGWLVCDGAALSRTEFARLFAVIGEMYGQGDGSTTYNLPDFANRSPMGADTWTSEGAPLTTVGGTALSRGGAPTHVLSSSEMPVHQHDMTHTHTVDVTDDATASSGIFDYVAAGIDNAGNTGTFTTSTPGATNNTGSMGGGMAHNNLHPYFAVTYIIFVGD